MTVTMSQNDSLARHSMTETITLISLRETYFSIPSSIISSTWKSNRRPANKQANNLIGSIQNLKTFSLQSIFYTEMFFTENLQTSIH